MRRILLALLPAAGVALAAAPAFAQDYDSGGFNDVIPSGGGVHSYGSTFTPAPSAG